MLSQALIVALLLALPLTKLDPESKTPPNVAPVDAPRGSVSIAAREVTHTGAAFPERSVTRLFQTRRSALTACYERELRANPALTGRIVIALTIQSTGSLGRVTVVSNALGNDAVASCASRVVSGLRFNPAPETDATFTVPIDFSLRGRR